MVSCQSVSEAKTAYLLQSFCGVCGDDALARKALSVAACNVSNGLFGSIIQCSVSVLHDMLSMQSLF